MAALFDFPTTIEPSRKSVQTMFTRSASFVRKAWQRALYPIKPYWTANIYGFGKWIRRYGYYPPFLPLYIYTDHGPGENFPDPAPHELNSGAPVQFYHSPRKVEHWRSMSAVPCHTLYSPFVFARQAKRIGPDPCAKGSIYFVAHSTPSIDAQKSVERYHREFQALPGNYRPITVCLHIHDMRRGLDKEFIALGYRVESAGDSLDQGFTERFYRLVAEHRFALSDLFGSYGLYTTEMGIPFGLHGSVPEFNNKSDPNIESGAYTSYLEMPYYREVTRMFGSLPGEHPTSEQQQFAAHYLGLGQGISRLKMAKVLYSSLFKGVYRQLVGLLSHLLFRKSHEPH